MEVCEDFAKSSYIPALKLIEVGKEFFGKDSF